MVGLIPPQENKAFHDTLCLEPENRVSNMDLPCSVTLITYYILLPCSVTLITYYYENRTLQS